MSAAEVYDYLRLILAQPDVNIAGGIWLLGPSDRGRLSRLLREVPE